MLASFTEYLDRSIEAYLVKAVCGRSAKETHEREEGESERANLPSSFSFKL